jgi:hypothetical protein
MGGGGITLTFVIFYLFVSSSGRVLYPGVPHTLTDMLKELDLCGETPIDALSDANVCYHICRRMADHNG